MRTEEQKLKHAEYMRRWKAANPEKYQATIQRLLTKDPDYYRRKARLWRQENPEAFAKQKRRNQVRQYGITPEQYKVLAAQQCGLCAICRTKPQRDLDIDHCHSTGRVRGLLCSRCNRGLGIWRDNVELLRAALQYLNNGVR